MYEQDLFNEPTWVPPIELPDLSKEKLIAIDVETRDPRLLTHGPGWTRNDGYLIGIAVACSKWYGYLPIAHEGGANLSKNIVIKWLKDQLKHGMSVVFHHAQYDLGWLKTEGIEIPGTILDTMIAAPLLDENRYSYALGALGATYLGEKKKEEGLESQFGGLHREGSGSCIGADPFPLQRVCRSPQVLINPKSSDRIEVDATPEFCPSPPPYGLQSA